MLPRSFSSAEFLLVRGPGMRPFLIGHRGSPSVAPENTLSSFRHALDIGCDAVEFDVHQASDGTLVVSHDESLLRTAGVDKLIADLKLEEIRKLDVGSWFSSKFRGERIPLMEEAISAIVQRGIAVVEIKHGNDFYPGIERRIISVLEKHREWIERCVFISFDPTVIDAINGKLRTGLLVADTVDEYIDVLRECGAQAMFPSWEKLKQRDVQALHSSGYSVHPWVVDSVQDAEKMLAMKPDSISTNRPEILSEMEIFSSSP